MERPPAESQTKQREITAEIVYLDEMRRLNQEPKPFLELGDMAMQMYESTADLYTNGERPEIMDAYEQYDPKPSEVVASCTALADELLTFKEADSPLTFVDIVIKANPDDVLAKLQTIAAGSILAGNDAQLAIPSEGEYYPILDMRKQNAKLGGVGLRVWGWDDPKYIFTNKPGEPYKYPENALLYPSDEKSSTRQIELSFSYRDAEAGSFTESVSLFLTAHGSASISSNIWASAYAETGYEGHGGSSLQDPSDENIAAFGDLIAEIVGDTPESISMYINNQLRAIAEAAASPAARQAIEDLITATWPAQASYFLRRRLQGTDTSIARQLRDETTADAAIAAIQTIIAEWKAKR
ncbi:MAG: hypothetical protein JWN38_166 [Candidatus Saccharibacteria bacterium]|nr:hypothetical protein [Candidatus Saccharibacteria bacterium]